MSKKVIVLPENDPNSFDNLEDLMFMELLSTNVEDPVKFEQLKNKWVKIITEQGQVIDVEK
jgi:hypothetical protein